MRNYLTLPFLLLHPGVRVEVAAGTAGGTRVDVHFPPAIHRSPAGCTSTPRAGCSGTTTPPRWSAAGRGPCTCARTTGASAVSVVPDDASGLSTRAVRPSPLARPPTLVAVDIRCRCAGDVGQTCRWVRTRMPIRGRCRLGWTFEAVGQTRVAAGGGAHRAAGAGGAGSAGTPSASSAGFRSCAFTTQPVAAGQRQGDGRQVVAGGAVSAVGDQRIGCRAAAADAADLGARRAVSGERLDPVLPATAAQAHGEIGSEHVADPRLHGRTAGRGRSGHRGGRRVQLGVNLAAG